MGELHHEPFQFEFNGFLKVAFQGSRITSDAGLLLVRELDERLGLATLISEHLSDSRQGLNTQFSLADLLRQSVYSRLAGYEDLNCLNLAWWLSLDTAVKTASLTCASRTRASSSANSFSRAARAFSLEVLAEEAKAAGVPIATQSLIRHKEGFGVPVPELPFEGKNAGKRIGALKDQHQLIAKLHKDHDEEEHRRQTIDAYFHLRMAWERAVEEVLLRKVVLRFRKGVETQRLAQVVVDDDDYARVEAGMTKCSNYAHDNAAIAGIAVPDPDELLADIRSLDNWRSSVETRATAIGKKRKG